MAGFFKKIKNKLQNFLFDEVVVDDDGNEKIIENNIEKMFP